MGKFYIRNTRRTAFERMMEVPKGPGRPEPLNMPQQKKRGYVYRKKGVRKS